MLDERVTRGPLSRPVSNRTEADVPKLGPGVDSETAAEVVRTERGLGREPIENMIRLLEMHGVRVFSLAEDPRGRSVQLLGTGTPFAFLNTMRSAEHSRRWEVVVAEDRPRATHGTGVDAVIRARRRS